MTLYTRATRKNDGITVVMSYNLPDCEEGKVHVWGAVKTPQGCQSGWHVDKCGICGLTSEYDTSD